MDGRGLVCCNKAWDWGEGEKVRGLGVLVLGDGGESVLQARLRRRCTLHCDHPLTPLKVKKNLGKKAGGESFPVLQH